MTFNNDGRREFLRRLGDDWQELADQVDIEHHESRRFKPGYEARGIWEWLADRKRLGELPDALVAVGREDLADALRSAPQILPNRPGLRDRRRVATIAVPSAMSFAALLVFAVVALMNSAGSDDSANGASGVTDPSVTPGAAMTTAASPGRRITVWNEVTDGATSTREDTETFLSTRTTPYCRRDGCVVPGTDMTTGAKVTITCWIEGSRMTNGQDENPEDDKSPQLVDSKLWYLARNSAGVTGYISEVSVAKDDRGKTGLSECDANRLPS